MRTMIVVMLLILAQYLPQVPFTVAQQVIQTFAP
jgi:hypothetical protein